MKSIRGLALVAVVASFALVGCGQKEETAGQKLDRTINKTEEGAKKAADKTGDAVEDAGKKMQDATK